MVNARACLTAITLVFAAAGACRAATLTTLYQFAGAPTDGKWPVAGLVAIGGNFYGTTEYDGADPSGCGSVFKFNLATGAESLLHSFSDAPDGCYPVASLIDFRGALYGTAYNGGTPGHGIVFQIGHATGVYSIVYAPPIGAPVASLQTAQGQASRWWHPGRSARRRALSPNRRFGS